MQFNHEDVKARVQRILADQLGIEEHAFNDDFRWLDKMGNEDAGYFLAEVNDAFVKIPSGFSLGAGKQPFSNVDSEHMEQIATPWVAW